MGEPASRADVPSPLLGLPPLLGGRYRVRRALGQGSLARVVAARDEVEERDVALKVLHANLRRDPIVAARFEREAEIVRRIEHPHVIRIYDVVEDGDLLFLVMELHPGGDLADRLARGGPLAPTAVRRLAEQLCGALEAAHRAGVVHRDIKPQNVLVGPSAALDVRLCDFGLARVADSAGLTTRTTVLGTPEYMAPEVIVDGYCDPRSDIYSVGALLFEAATGRLPFRADTPFQLMRRHVEEAPPRPRDVAPDLPPEIDEAIVRALGKEPLDRFATAAELGAAIAGAGGARETSATLARLGRPSRAAAGTCRRCGSALSRVAQVCVDCGAASLSLRARVGGVAVLVTGPGKIAHKLGGRAHVALVRLLGELPPHAARLERLRKRPPRLPFFLMKNLEDESAHELVTRLAEVGLEARVEPKASLRAREVRRKIVKMWRAYGLMAFALTNAPARLFLLSHDRHRQMLWLLALLLPVVVAPLGALAWLGVSQPRPLAALAPTSEEDTALAQLARCLATLRRREDRRLLARLLDRLEVATELGAGDAAALLGARAVLACRGLVALDDAHGDVDDDEARRTAARPVLDDDARTALVALRETERRRGVLVADLLRGQSRLDLLCLKLARAGGLGAHEQVELAAREIVELTTELDADREVAALLGNGT